MPHENRETLDVQMNGNKRYFFFPGYIGWEQGLLTHNRSVGMPVFGISINSQSYWFM